MNRIVGLVLILLCWTLWLGALLELVKIRTGMIFGGVVIGLLWALGGILIALFYFKSIKK